MLRKTRLSLGVATVAATALAVVAPTAAFATTTHKTTTTAAASKSTLAPGASFAVRGRVKDTTAGKYRNGLVVVLYKRLNSGASWTKVASKKTSTISGRAGSYSFSQKAMTHPEQYSVRHPAQTVNAIKYAGSSSAAVSTKTARTLTVAPSTSAYNGAPLAVTGFAFAKNATVNLWECHTNSTSGGLGTCDTTHAVTHATDQFGNFSTTFSAVAGPVGDGICGAPIPDASSLTCYIVASTDATNSDATKASAARVDFSFTSVSPATNLADAQVVQVAGQGFPAHANLLLVECDISGGASITACDLAHATGAITDGNGVMQTPDGLLTSVPYTVKYGAIGSTGHCTELNPACVIAVANAATNAPYGGALIGFAAPA